MGEEGDGQIPRGPSGLGGDLAAVAGPGAGRLGDRAGDPRRRRAARHGPYPRARDRHLLHHVQPRAGRRQGAHPGVRHDALLAARRQRSQGGLPPPHRRRAPPVRRRRLLLGGGRVPRRLRECADGADRGRHLRGPDGGELREAHRRHRRRPPAEARHPDRPPVSAPLGGPTTLLETRQRRRGDRGRRDGAAEGLEARATARRTISSASPASARRSRTAQRARHLPLRPDRRLERGRDRLGGRRPEIQGPHRARGLDRPGQDPGRRRPNSPASTRQRRADRPCLPTRTASSPISTACTTAA